jgi:hypothetical protein
MSVILEFGFIEYTILLTIMLRIKLTMGWIYFSIPSIIYLSMAGGLCLIQHF